jgi:hypothetical protein
VREQQGLSPLVTLKNSSSEEEEEEEEESDGGQALGRIYPESRSYILSTFATSFAKKWGHLGGGDAPPQ